MGAVKIGVLALQGDFAEHVATLRRLKSEPEGGGWGGGGGSSGGGFSGGGGSFGGGGAGGSW